MKIAKSPRWVRLGSVYVNPDAAEKLKIIGDAEKRSMVKQAAYVIEEWAGKQK